jgi:hypothetical protein
MKLNDFLNAAKGRISGGSAYGWSCYPNAQSVDVSDDNGNDCGSAIFNRTSHYVYEATVCVPNTQVAFRWSDAEFAWARIDESRRRHVDDTLAWDDVKWTAIVEEDTMLNIVKSVVELKDWDHWAADDTVADVNTSGCGGDCSSCSCRDDECGDVEVEVVDTAEEQDCSNMTEYNVSIDVTYTFDVKANSMEEAVAKAKEFATTMKPVAQYDYDVSWMDHYASKETVSRNLRTESIED